MVIRSTCSPVLKIGFQLLGIWPSDLYSTVHFLSIILGILIILYFQYLYIFEHMKISEIPNLIDCLTLTISYNSTLFKLIGLWIRRQIFRQMLVAMDNDWRECINMEEHLYMMTVKANVAYFISNGLLCINAVATVLYLLGEYVIRFVFLSDDQNDTLRQLPIKIQLPFETQQSPLFEFFAMTLFLYTIILASTQAILNGLILTWVLHISGQIDIMCHELRNISIKSTSFHEHTVSLFKVLIERHNRIVLFSKNIEKLVSFIAFMEVVWTTLLICCLGFFIIIMIHNNTGAFVLTKTILGLFVMMCQIFVICFTGEHLSYKGKLIVSAAYESPWYDIPSHQSKMLILIIMRSQKQLAITAGKMMDMSLETFTNVIKASMSYVSILNALY